MKAGRIQSEGRKGRTVKASGKKRSGGKASKGGSKARKK
jgi:hypothetical protein